MKSLNFLLFFILFILCCTSYAQVTIEFNDSGQVIGSPPEKIQMRYKHLSYKHYIDINLRAVIHVRNETVDRRINLVFGKYLQALDNVMKLNDSTIVFSGFKKEQLAKLNQVRDELFTQLVLMNNKYHNQLDFPYSSAFEKIISSGVCRNVNSMPPRYVPRYDSLIRFSYYLEVNEYGDDGNRINNSCNNIKVYSHQLSTECNDYVIEPIIINHDCAYFDYKLFEDNFYFPSLKLFEKSDSLFNTRAFTTENDEHFGAFKNSTYSETGYSLYARSMSLWEKVFKHNSLTEADVLFINDTLNMISQKYAGMNLDAITQSDFVLSYLWINQGIPSLNPFEFASFQSPSSVIHKLFMNNLLYSGILFTNQNNIVHNNNGYNGSYVMRNHDALNDYAVMNKSCVHEIVENETMKILVYNDQKENTLKQSFTETSKQASDAVIPGMSNKSLLNETNLYLNTSGGNKTILQLEEFIRVYNAMLFFRNGFPHLPSTEIVDANPDFVTREVSHFVKGRPPERVNYTVYKSVATNDKSNTIPVDSNAYRINKLYHFRFKAGVVYSWLQTKDYDVNANPITLNTATEGFNAVVGMQYFIKKQDIRNPKFHVRPFLFGGFAVTGKVYDHPYFGIGSELINGFGLMLGINWAKSERLDYSNGLFIENDNHYKGGFFISAVIDLNLINQLFSIPSITGTYK